MTPMREKVARGRLDGDPGPGVSSARREVSAGKGEREGRRAGVLLIVLGCVLMALAVGEARADTHSAEARDTPVQAVSGLV